MVFSFKDQYNFVYISATCSWSLEYLSLDSSQPATEQFFHEQPFMWILSYSLMDETSWEEKMNFAIILLSVISSVSFIFLLGCFLTGLYFKKKYIPHLHQEQGILEMSLLKANQPQLISLRTGPHPSPNSSQDLTPLHTSTPKATLKKSAANSVHLTKYKHNDLN